MMPITVTAHSAERMRTRCISSFPPGWLRQLGRDSHPGGGLHLKLLAGRYVDRGRARSMRKAQPGWRGGRRETPVGDTPMPNGGERDPQTEITRVSDGVERT